MTRRFDFAFTPGYRIAALPFAITPARAWVDVGREGLVVRFGWWRLTTGLDNVVGAERTGGYAFVKTAGPPHLSFTDRGVTFATNGDAGVCLRFADPVHVLDPTGRLRHPGATVTVADVDGLIGALTPGGRRPAG